MKPSCMDIHRILICMGNMIFFSGVKKSAVMEAVPMVDRLMNWRIHRTVNGRNMLSRQSNSAVEKEDLSCDVSKNMISTGVAKWAEAICINVRNGSHHYK